MNFKLVGLLLGVTSVGLAWAVQDSPPAGARASDKAARTAGMVRANRAAVPAAQPASGNVGEAVPVSTVTEEGEPDRTDPNAALQEENRRLRAKVEQLEARLNELLTAEAEPTAIEAPPPAAKETPPDGAIRTRRADQPGKRRNASRTVIHIHRHEPCEACAAAQRKAEEVQKQLEQAQQQVKEAAQEREAAESRAVAVEKEGDELARSLKSVQEELDLAKADGEAAIRSRDEALRTVEYSKKERDDAKRSSDQALRQAKEAATSRDTALTAAKVAEEERYQARQEVQAAQQDRDEARRISQELQRQRLAAYDEAKAARAEVVPTRRALVVAEQLAEDRRQLAERFQSADHEWSQFAVQLADAAGVKEPLPPQEVRWSGRESATRAWLDKVRERHVQVLALGSRPSDADRTGANFAYVEGVRHLRQQNYSGAIQRLSEAIDAYPNDARYFYLRGIARHSAGNGTDVTEAERDVRRAAELEKQSAPNSRAVDQALERFQGASRLWAEKFRR